MRWLLATIIASILSFLAVASAASQADPICVVFNGVRVGPDKVPAVLFFCDNEAGPTFRVVSEPFYRQFSDAPEPLWIRKSLIR